MNIHWGLRLVAVAAVLFTAMPAAWADRGHEGHSHWRHDNHGQAHGHGFASHDRRDRDYPRHGAQARGHRSHGLIPRPGIGYYFSAGPWYRPLLPQLMVKPPVGALVRMVPLYAIAVWVGGITYYYADGIYYVWSPYRQGYVVSMGPFDR